MNRIITAHTRVLAAVATVVSRRIAGPRDRGDVPGWVLITIMTAGLVTALWALAGPQLGQLFSDAISDVKGP
ncbi:hypothetical protein LJR027_002839 [Terrabacter sp. LjRoot27]|uniref:hypothetical protein n=1 Tax=Terrabacter sp. LjRoot27 TaxID=3342306 RepID=UPI003ECFC40E